MIELKWVEGNLSVDSVINIRTELSMKKIPMEGRVIYLPDGCWIANHKCEDRVFGFNVRHKDIEPNTFEIWHLTQFDFGA